LKKFVIEKEKEVNSLKNENTKNNEIILTMKEEINLIKSKNDEELNLLKNKYEEEIEKLKSEYSEKILLKDKIIQEKNLKIQDLKGNIRVFCR
jgi:hypothetical protein